MTEKKNFRFHLTQILGRWEGIPVILRKLSHDLDENGNIVNTDETDYDMTAIISSYSENLRDDAAGYINTNEKVGLFMYESGEPMPEIDDLVIENLMFGKTYSVVRIDSIDYDIDEPVLIRTTLQEVPHHEI